MTQIDARAEEGERALAATSGNFRFGPCSGRFYDIYFGTASSTLLWVVRTALSIRDLHAIRFIRDSKVFRLVYPKKLAEFRRVFSQISPLILMVKR